MTVSLYRAVCNAEFVEVMANRQFGLVPNSLNGKWFAESLKDARAWGEVFSRLSGISHDKIIEAEFEQGFADGFFRLPMLDGIGPARFATIDEANSFLSVREATR